VGFHAIYTDVTLLDSDQLVAWLRERRPRVAGGAGGRFAGSFSWEALRRCLASPRLEREQVTLVRDGATLQPESASAVEGHIAAGAVLLLKQVHRVDRRVWDLTREVEAAVRNLVSANVYAGGPGSAGFDFHVDHHDVVVLQIEGRKHWEIYEPTLADPILLPEHMRGEPRTAVWEGVLEEGQTLFLPRGFWHRARGAESGRTLHVSLGIEPATGLHLLGWLRDQLLEAAVYRADIPRFGSDDERARHATALRNELTARLDAGAIDTYLEHRYDRVRRQNDELAARLWRDD
jgi:ribosomal protein L16 Arg81 hydroxylase